MKLVICPCCNKLVPDEDIELRRQNTRYADDTKNYKESCLECFKYDCEYWDEKWKEVWGSGIMNDPCRGCRVYKEVGCSHVDSYLCDFPVCSMLQDYIRRQEDLPSDMQKILSDNLSDLYED